MKVRISGSGAAQVPEQTIDWPFPVPPATKMRIQWRDDDGNVWRGSVDVVTYDAAEGLVYVSVSIA